MKRNENQPAGQTTGCFSVPLFNQKKRIRVPCTSTPTENQFFSLGELTVSTSMALPCQTAGTCGSYQAPAASPGAQCPQWSSGGGPSQTSQHQQYGGNRPALATSPYPLLPHPYKAGNTSCTAPQLKNPLQQQASSFALPHRHLAPCSAETKPPSSECPAPMSRPLSFKPPGLPRQCNQQVRLPLAPVPLPGRPSTAPTQLQKNWQLTNSFKTQNSNVVEKHSASQPQQSVQRLSTPETSPMAPGGETSLRILTAVINGMRHWSQFKDKVPILFEIFGTLDSAVTLGRHGAKSFLLRDGQHAVQCEFYENEQGLPRLIRGQAHRCLGNYDPCRGVLVCVSVRASQPWELRGAGEAVKACDAEMRRLVRIFSEV